MKKIKILIFFSIVFVLVLSSFNICKAITFSNLTRLKRTEQINNYSYQSDELSAQGVCTDGTYIYVAIVSKEGKKSPYVEQKTKILVINAKNMKLVKRVNIVGKIGHSNALAYNSKNKTIILAPCSSEIKHVYQIYTKDIIKSENVQAEKVYLKNKNDKKINASVWGISYNSETNEYFVAWGQSKIKVFDENFKEKRDIDLNIKLKTNENHTGQTIYCDSKYIYYIYNNLKYGLDNTINYIKIYNHNGMLIKIRIIGNTGSEFESMFNLSGEYYTIGNSVEENENNKSYKIKLFRVNI